VKYPSLEFVPEPLRGQTRLVLRAAFAGPEAAGVALIKPWLAWRAPIEDTFRQMPFREIGTISNDPVNPTAAVGSNEMFDELSDGAIDAIVRLSTDSSSPLLMCELRHAEGAISRVPADATPLGHRAAAFYLQLGGPTATPAAYSAVNAYIARFKTELRPYVRGSVYLNFMKGEDGRHRVKDAYPPASYERLRVLKARYDPDNLFRFSYDLSARVPQK
jgi:FAD/FMN-containing dehydrogenase